MLIRCSHVHVLYMYVVYMFCRYIIFRHCTMYVYTLTHIHTSGHTYNVL